MSTRSTKTIDNLGIEVYRRYDDDQSVLETVYIGESKQVALRSSLDILLPIQEDEVSLLLEDEKSPPWALLCVPDKYNEQKRRLFTNQLTPASGPVDKLEMQEAKIEEIKEDLEKKIQEIKSQPSLITSEEQEETEDIAVQAKKLLDLLQDIRLSNKMIRDINAERYRYTKG
ncbi:MAG: hypothetical protein FJZ56_07050 [Chlamydiae bacterium]|nr:hypothetical protein [Chlamydiota bacterium]